MKFLKNLVIMLLLSFLFMGCVTTKKNRQQDEIVYKIYEYYFPWITLEIYNIVEYYSIYYRVNKTLIFSLIDQESHGKNVIGKKNRNGTRDYGLMQINSVHCPKNPKKLLDYNLNIRKGVWYLSLGLKKSRGNIREACRYYNQGINGKRHKYKNWKYVGRIVDIYNDTIGLSNVVLFAMN